LGSQLSWGWLSGWTGNAVQPSPGSWRSRAGASSPGHVCFTRRAALRQHRGNPASWSLDRALDGGKVKKS